MADGASIHLGHIDLCMITPLWLCTALPCTHIVKYHFDTKVHIYAFVMLILNDANKINTIKLSCAQES